jgi:serine/threonine protein phosphatase PrpC
MHGVGVFFICNSLSKAREAKKQVDTCRYAAATKEGANKGRQVGGSNNQDSTFASVINNGLSLFGVFDGHGENGARVSSFVAQRLPFEVARLGKF